MKENLVSELLEKVQYGVILSGEFEVLDGDGTSFIVRHMQSDSDFEISIKEIAP